MLIIVNQPLQYYHFYGYEVTNRNAYKLTMGGQNSSKPKKTIQTKQETSPPPPPSLKQEPEPELNMEVPVRSKEEAPSSGAQKEDTLETFFLTYKDPDNSTIMAGGVERFCNDLKVDPTDFIVLAIAWKFQADRMCMFTREQFMNGCSELNVKNLREFRKALPGLKAEVCEKANFKKLYYFTFQFGLEQGQRILPIEMAIPMWECVFQGAPSKPKHLDDWIGFLKDSGAKVISKDTWNMFYHFLETVKVDLSNYDETDAWPTLFDDFYDFKTGKKVTKTA
eukprot:TRINITY_DN238_c0_g1_i1.p1 TRINITY_DN238_c0_g1~~TRINITY_DN238_c0_g1_i1.p1  ORF type:complete len:280 (+),score=58.59 TRINITY_DN238_c0_g1_i1:105-944(+)